MNKICKEYMGEVKALFPILKKQERTYLKKLSSDVEDYCEEAKVASKQELYKNYGMPHEVVSNYISTVDTEYVVKQLKINKFIRRAVIIILALATITTIAYGLYMRHVIDILEYNKGVFEESIEDHGTNNGIIIDEGIIEEEIIVEEIIEEEIIEEEIIEEEIIEEITE